MEQPELVMKFLTVLGAHLGYVRDHSLEGVLVLLQLESPRVAARTRGRSSAANDPALCLVEHANSILGASTWQVCLVTCFWLTAS